jgi:hypothetical protein
MRIIKLILFCAFVFSANIITAQYGNSNGYGGNSGYGSNNGYGGNRSQSQMSQTPTQNTPKEVPVEKTAAKIVEYYKKELNLDALQEIVITNVFTKSLKKQEALMKKEISDEDKTNEFKVLSEMTDLEVMEVLNKEQKEKYKILSEERKSKIESRKH